MSGRRRTPWALTRRRLLAGGAAAVSAVAVARLLGVSLRRSRRGGAKPYGEGDVVALVGCDDYRPEPLREAVERVLELAPPPDVRGKSVLLKPNFVEYAADRPVTTHVELLRATIRAFRDLGASRIVVAEGPGHNPDTDEVWGRSGLFRMAAEEGAAVVDLNHDDVGLVRLRTFPPEHGFRGRALEHVFLPKTLLAADVIVSMPKMKTHHWAGITLGMKNLFGVVPSVKYGWPKNLLHVNGIQRSIVELAASVPVAYVIVDGVEGMEGDGPIMGTPVPSHCLLFGRSPYAVDWTGARVMGLDPSQVDFLRLASATGFGPLADPPTVGEAVATLRRPFAVPPRFDSLRG
jgi:uncharacterized protein (DUF362 family)